MLLQSDSKKKKNQTKKSSYVVVPTMGMKSKQALIPSLGARLEIGLWCLIKL